MTTPPYDPHYKRLDQKINAVLAVVVINLILLVLASLNVIDLAHITNP